MVDAIAPTWDGNETWLIMAGVAMLAGLAVEEFFSTHSKLSSPHSSSAVFIASLMPSVNNRRRYF